MLRLSVAAFSSHGILFVPTGSIDAEIGALWHRVARPYSCLPDSMLTISL